MQLERECRYICHKCGCLFDFPNPLKLHLALECDKLDIAQLWAQLAREFDSVLQSSSQIDPRQDLSLFSPLSIYLLNSSARSSCTTVSPITINANVMMACMSSLPGSVGIVPEDRLAKPEVHCSWPVESPYPLLPSPLPSTSLSSRLTVQNSLMKAKNERQQHHSAFKPYIMEPESGSMAPPLMTRDHGASLVSCLARTATTQAVHPLPTNAHAAAQTENIASNLGRLRQGHQCIYCGRIYSRKYGLKIHIRTHTGYKPLKCKFCLRPFGDPSNLNKHVRLHADGETPYKCDLCGKVLVRRRDLERHVKSRHHSRGTDRISEISSDETDI
ncbi:hypothetical protein QAD02_003710 [Eretmocerus hayati]|uniref:Uncharacterized protein n=1 Tax=Eretmocerus hayati TaxID=131215 RepID=A0ACC2NNH3_9HYME|nr:hypothetical protein QAD02_003710 [Eretmocerus hayati]